MAPAGAVAAVSVGGRVTTAGGAPIRQAYVALMDSNGDYFWTLSNGFGYYQISNVTPGVTYQLIAWAKEHTFTNQEIDVNNNITSLDIVAEP